MFTVALFLACVGLINAQLEVVCNEQMQISMPGEIDENAEHYPMFYKDTRGNRSWMFFGKLPYLENEDGSYAQVWQGKLNTKIPYMGQTEPAGVLLKMAYKNENRKDGEMITEAIDVKYVCTPSMMNQQAVDRLNEQNRLRYVSCRGIAQKAKAFIDSGFADTLNFVEPVLTSNSARTTCNQNPDSCECITYRIRRARNLMYNREDCPATLFEGVDVQAILDHELDNMYSRRCVSAPCGAGGFCSRDNMCTGDFYTASFDDECGSNGKCCVPDCSVRMGGASSLAVNGVLAPGICSDSATSVQGNDGSEQPMVCLELPNHNHNADVVKDRVFRKEGVNRCALASHCCVRPICEARQQDNGNGNGLCVSDETCAANNGSPKGKGKCPGESTCCFVGDNRSSIYSYSHVSANDVNKEGLSKAAQFRDNGKTLLEASATTTAIAGVVAGVAVVANL